MTNVLLIGDSICLDYSPYLRSYLKKTICLHGKPDTEAAYRNLDVPRGGNGGDSGMVLNFVEELAKAEMLYCEYFVFNCGLHDLRKSRESGVFQTPIEKYKENLMGIVNRMKHYTTKTIFINTTPSERNRYHENLEFVRFHKDVLAYNRAAGQIMEENGIPVLDLYGFTCSLNRTGDELYRDHTHFQPEVIRLQAAYLAGALNIITK